MRETGYNRSRMDVAVLRALGDCGREIAAQLVRSASLPADPLVHLTRLESDAQTGETLWALFGPHAAVEAAVAHLRASDSRRAVTFAVVAL